MLAETAAVGEVRRTLLLSSCAILLSKPFLCGEHTSNAMCAGRRVEQIGQSDGALQTLISLEAWGVAHLREESIEPEAVSRLCAIDSDPDLQDPL